MAHYAMKQQQHRPRTITVPNARPGTLGAHLSGLTLLVVSEEQAIRNRQIEDGRKLAAREAREELEAATRAQQESEKAAGVPAATEQSTVAAETPKVRVVHVATPEETAAFRAEIDQREAALLKAGRHADAIADKGRLLTWATKTKPSTSAFVEALLECGFVYDRDDRNAAVYTSQGVEIRAFGAAMGQTRNDTRPIGRRLTADQEKARARRAHKPAAASTTPVRTTAAPSEALSAEERAALKAENIRKAALALAAKEAKQAAWKAAHPKVKAIKVPKKEPKTDKKGGKGKGGSKK